jgi:hypothetical protein
MSDVGADVTKHLDCIESLLGAVRNPPISDVSQNTLGTDPTIQQSWTVTDSGEVVGSYTMHQTVQAGEAKLGDFGVVQLSGGTMGYSIVKAVGTPAKVVAAADISVAGGTVHPFRGATLSLK